LNSHKHTFFLNRITQLFKIKYPIIQAGMIWCSGWKLAAAVSKEGGLGIIGSGSMYPDVLREHLAKYRAATDYPFAVNLPLLYTDIEQHVKSIIDYKVPIVFTSAGNPNTWTSKFKDHGIKVVQVVSSSKFAIKSQEAGVDAIVAEGFEAGGHNGRDETTTLCLIPEVRRHIDIPLIAAGGIGSGAAIAACMALGADGVQIGSLFATSVESSAHISFKERIIASQEGETMLCMKKIIPVRLLKNKFYEEITHLENICAGSDKINNHLGRGRAKKGMFEGDMENGELEIGQIAASINKIKTVKEIMHDLILEYNSTIKNKLSNPL